MSTLTATENLSSSKSSGCNITLFPGASNPITLPSGPANQTGGTATSWLFLYRNAAEGLLVVTVLDGKASALATIAAGQSCSTVFGLLNVIPSNVIDSSVAAADVKSDAATFLAAHPDVTSRYGLIGGLSFLGLREGAEWEVNYTSCAVDASPGTTGASFNATVNATSGAVIYQHTLGLVDCSSTGAISLIHGPTPTAPLERPVNPLIPVPRENSRV